MFDILVVLFFVLGDDCFIIYFGMLILDFCFLIIIIGFLLLWLEVFVECLIIVVFLLLFLIVLVMIECW